jgi:DNA-binding Lrp family transcriptional regulator
MIEDKWQRGDRRILKMIEKFTNFKNWISFMQLSIEAKIDHPTLTNHIEQLIKHGIITEYRGKNHSRLFCISGHQDDIEYNEEFRTFTQNDTMSKENAEEKLSMIYKLGIDGLYYKY